MRLVNVKKKSKRNSFANCSQRHLIIQRWMSSARVGAHTYFFKYTHSRLMISMHLAFVELYESAE